MLDRRSIDDVFRAALGRAPDGSERSRCQRMIANMEELIQNLIASDEFKSRSWHRAAAEMRQAASAMPASSWNNEPSDIEWAYKTILGRAPENYAVVVAWLHHRKSREQIAEEFIGSEEFKSKSWHDAAAQLLTELAAFRKADPYSGTSAAVSHG